MDIISWAIILGMDLFSICVGIYCVYTVIKAYREGKDITKYNGYIISAFVWIVMFPIIFTEIAPMQLIKKEKRLGSMFLYAINDPKESILSPALIVSIESCVNAGQI